MKARRIREEAEREFSDMEEIWKSEKSSVQGATHIKEELERARAELDNARRAQDWSRMAELQHGRIPELEQQLEQARVEFRQDRAAYRSAKQAVAQARGELDAARSRIALGGPSDDLSTRASIRAPVDGRILQVHQESAGVVQAGAPLVTMGHPDSLEVSVDVLSSDAVRVTEGTPVEIVRWGGGGTLDGRVRAVPPQGQTEVSALGVEEQRVEVLVDFADPPQRWTRLGTGYRVVARFILWAEDDVLQVPQSALFRHDGGWAVFAVRGGRAERQPVDVGYRSGLRAQITDGLSEGTRVVTHPGEELEDGRRVEAR